MRIIAIISIIIFYFAASSAYSQGNYPQSVGLNLSMKAGISVIQTPIGRQNGISFNGLPDVGITYYHPLTKDYPLGLILNGEYCNYSFNIKDFGDGTLYNHSISYIAFAPSLYFDGFTLGFGFGMPVSSDMEGKSIDVGNINTLVDLRLGYILNLYFDESASLNIYFTASYMLTHVYNDFIKNDPLKEIVPEQPDYPINNSHNPRAAAVTIGLNYNFNFSE